jgi:hypothetical protein
MLLPTIIAKEFMIGSKKEHLYKDFRESDCPVFEKILLLLPWEK